MTAQGSAEVRFWRGIAAGKPVIAQSIALEMRRVGIEHALALLLLIRDVERDRYDAFAARFLTKLHKDTNLSVADLAIASTALAGIAAPRAEAGARALRGLLEALREPEAVRVLDRWLDAKRSWSI